MPRTSCLLALVGASVACNPSLPPASAFGVPTSHSVIPHPDGGVTDAGAPDAGNSDGGPAGTRAIGAPCSRNSDCQSGDCQLQVPGGYCSASCAGDAPCPSGSRCTQASGGAMLCLMDCTAQSECRTGYVCQPAEGVCNLPCQMDNQCASGETCEVTTGRCLDTGTCHSAADCGPGQTCDATGHCAGGAGLIGGSCAVTSDCTHGAPQQTCLTDTMDSFPGGYCVSSCVLGSTTCPDDGQCVQGVVPNGRVCVSTCNTSADCRYDYQCVPIPNRASVCMPPCQNAMLCGSSQQCDTATGVCQGGGQVGGLNGVDAGI